MGAAPAGILNTLTTRTDIETAVGLQWQEGELILLCRNATLEELRVELSVLYGAVRRRTTSPEPAHADPVDQLERLAGLLEKGLLSRDEFEEAKAKLIRGLQAAPAMRARRWRRRVSGVG